MKSFLSNITKKYGQYLLIGLSLFVLSIALMGRAGVLAEVLKQGPQVVFAGPCPQGGCNGGEPTVEQYPQCGGDCNGTTYDGSHTVWVVKTTDASGNVSYACEDRGAQEGQCGNNPTTCNETPGEYPQCGGTCNGTTYDGSHTVWVKKNVDGACNVSYQCEDRGQQEGQCGNTSPPAFNETPRQYTQCGGECNGTTYDSSHTIDVNKNVDGSCNVSYSCNDLGAINGQCGNSTPPTQICTPGQRDANSRTCIGSTGCKYNLNECNSDGMGWHQVEETNCSLAPAGCNGMCTPNDNVGVVEQCVGTQMCKFNKWIGTMCNEGLGGAYGCRAANPGECEVATTSCFVCENGAYRTTSSNNCNTSSPACNPNNPGQGACTGASVGQLCPAPQGCVSNGSCSAAAPACGQTTQGVNNCGVACTRSGAACPAPTSTPPVLCQSNGSCSAAAPACGQTTQGVDNCNNVCFKQGLACPVATPTPGVTPSPTPATTTCGPNTRQEIGQNGAIVCVSTVVNQTQTQTNNQNQTVNVTAQGGSASINYPAAAAAAYQRAYVRTAGVPMKTGQVEVAGVQELPKTGLPLVAWMLVGVAPFGVKLRRFGRSTKEETTANSMWEDRQFKKS